MFSHLNIIITVEIILSKHFSTPEVMTSEPEVTTFWGRLGSFGDKNTF